MSEEKVIKRIGFKINLDLDEKVNNFCYNHNINKSDFICMAIKEKLYKDGFLPNEKVFSLDD
ncbi:hypothetical protein [Acetivibrio ethanolgignens]|uniref:Protein CopB n=1 Tax=Acetivibrio ethanolgignens TaxID=290052 RepID=A0A0V8QBF6_9FIRM|nr:hypothetical protein [Acetivibrio ethanolgignens]KSV57774.1 hypothetical protein ASU35_15135 [Acetivibrio ethanolgignens]